MSLILNFTWKKNELLHINFTTKYCRRTTIKSHCVSENKTFCKAMVIKTMVFRQGLANRAMGSLVKDETS